jgi:hypothetical protein
MSPEDKRKAREANAARSERREEDRLTQMLKDHPTVKTRRKHGASAQEVLTYITQGRARVLGTRYDPYKSFKKPAKKMAEDAMVIASWFNSRRRRWDDKQVMRADAVIIRIQHGPQRYFQTLFRNGLTTEQHTRAQQWALREFTFAGSVNMDADLALRNDLYMLLDKKLGLVKKDEPYKVIMDVLRFTYYGLKDMSGDDWSDL